MPLNVTSIDARATQRTGWSGITGVSLSAGSLTASHLEVDLARLHASPPTFSSIELRAARGEAQYFRAPGNA